jgi:DNA-binding winged helix-turn-helix (wHTH) protein
MDRAVSLEARRIELSIETPFLLGRARIDPSAHECTVGQSVVRMQPQAMKVLVALHDKIGEVVTRDELIDRCWDGRIVGEDVINRCILLLRRLSERTGGFQIGTVPRAGYRLIEAPAAMKPVRSYRVIAGIGIAGAAVVAIALFATRSSLRPPELAVIVLPFTAEQDDPLERAVAVNASDAVRRMLTESGVSVTEGRDGDRPTGSGSDLIVSGHVREDGQSVVASVTVEEARRNAVILSHELQSDRAHSADLPKQIGANVAGSLSWADRMIQIDEQHPSDPAAVSQLLDQFSSEEFNFWRTYEIARRHAPTAPDSAIAQWQLAMVTGLLMHGLPLADRPAAVAAARSAADRAYALDPRAGDFFIPWCLLHPQVRLLECEDHLRAGLRVDPQAAWAGSFLGNQMNNVGRIDEALMLEGASLAEDEFAPAKIAHAIMMFEAVGDSHRAQALYQQSVRLWPNFHFLFRLRVRGMTERGDFDALGRFEQQVGAAHLPPFYDSALTLAQAVRAHSLPRAKGACPKTSIDQKIVQCMLAFGELGDLDDAFAYADLVYPPRRGRTLADEERLWFADPFVLDTAFLTGAGAAPMRRDPRYLTLAERLGLINYWRSGRLPDFCTKRHEPVCTKIFARAG